VFGGAVSIELIELGFIAKLAAIDSDRPREVQIGMNRYDVCPEPLGRQ